MVKQIKKDNMRTTIVIFTDHKVPTDRNRLSFLKDSLVQWKEQWPSKPLIPVRIWEEPL